MADIQRRWTLRALEDSPRLHVISAAGGGYHVHSTDDILLYKMVDTRYLPTTDKWYTSEKKFWRCFLRTTKDVSAAEIRRHESATSDIGIHMTQGDKVVKTGLVCLASQAGTCRYTLKWLDRTYILMSTRQAPNSSPGDSGSLCCIDSKGTTIAWLTRQPDSLHSAGSICATVWFEDAGIQADLIEVILSSLLSITDVQYPYEPIKAS